jgi:hypothetical protein
MSDPDDFIARHIQKYSFGAEELRMFLAQSVPRQLPEALKHRGDNPLGVVVAIVVPVCLGIVLGPFYFHDALGNWAYVLAGMGLTLSVAAAIAAVKWVVSQPSLYVDGELTTATFSYIEPPKPENLRSAASKTHVTDLHRSGTVKLQFEVDGQTVQARQILPYQYLTLAMSYHETNADVFVLYDKQNPTNARWVGELLFPCPEPQGSVVFEDDIQELVEKPEDWK